MPPPLPLPLLRPTLLSELDVELAATVVAVAYNGEAEVADELGTVDPNDIPVP